ncbi:hypothetical protein IC582_013705 [Cucumis melo]
MKYITTIRLVLCCQGRHRGFLAVEALSIEEFWPSKLSCRCGFSSKIMDKGSRVEKVYMVE